MTETPHPYSQEWAGSHWGTTDDGVAYHVSCSSELAQDTRAMEALKMLIEVASKIPVKEIKKLNEANGPL